MVLADGDQGRGNTNRIKELSGFALETADSADGQQPGPEESLWTKVRAMAWSNLAYVRLIHEKQDGAEAQQTAQGCCRPLRRSRHARDDVYSTRP